MEVTRGIHCDRQAWQHGELRSEGEQSYLKPSAGTAFSGRASTNQAIQAGIH